MAHTEKTPSGMGHTRSRTAIDALYVRVLRMSLATSLCVHALKMCSGSYERKWSGMPLKVWPAGTKRLMAFAKWSCPTA